MPLALPKFLGIYLPSHLSLHRHAHDNVSQLVKNCFHNRQNCSKSVNQLGQRGYFEFIVLPEARRFQCYSNILL